MCGWMRACAGLALTVAVFHVTSADVFSSTYKLERMVLEEEKLLLELGDFADDQFRLLRNISMFSIKRKRKVELMNITQSLSEMKHPNSLYQYVLWSAMEYDKAFGKNFGIFQDSVQRDMGAILLNITDFNKVSFYLLRLQRIYNLNISDMINGNYLGFQGPKLVGIELGQLGISAYYDGHLNDSLLLTTKAFEAFAENNQNDKPIFAFTKPKVQSFLGRLHYYLGDFRTAQSIHKEINITDPTSEDTISLERLMNTGYPLAPKPSYSQDVFNSYSRLCRSNKEFNLNDAEISNLTCRYRESPIPYYRFHEEILSISPFISVFYNFTNDDESEHVRTVMKHQLMKLPDSVNLTSEILVKYETARAVAKRIESVTWLKLVNDMPDEPLSNDEVFKNMHKYDEYAIPFIEEDYKDNKLATFLIYLSDAETGGSTAFYNANISVSSKKNMAIFWYNLDPTHMTGQLTKSALCPVIYGDHWINVKWSLGETSMFPRRCVSNPNATHLDIERYIKNGYQS